MTSSLVAARRVSDGMYSTGKISVKLVLLCSDNGTNMQVQNATLHVRSRKTVMT